MSYGDSTGAQRESQETLENSKRTNDLVTDNLKNIFQFSEAIVLAKVEPPTTMGVPGVITTPVDSSGRSVDMLYYSVLLLREQREIVASHKKDHSFWATTAFPRVGDHVTIKHKRDLFQAEITEVLSVSLADAIAKYGRITKKAG